MADAGIAPPPAKKRGASRQLCKDDDGSDSEGQALPQDSLSFQKASDAVLASRRILKVRRTAGPVSSPHNPFASIRLVPPSSAVDVPLPLSAPGAPHSIHLPGTGECAASAPVVLAVDASVDVSGSNNIDVAQIETKKPEDSNRTADGDVLSREEKTVDGRVAGISGGEPVTFGEINLVATSLDRSGSLVNDQDGGGEQQDAEDQQKSDDSKNEAENGGTRSTEPSEHASSEKPAFASPLGSFGTGSSSFSFGTGPLFGSPTTGFASFRSGSAFGAGSESSSGSAFALKVAGDGVFSKPSPAFGNSNGATFQFSSEVSATSSLAPFSSSAQSSTRSFPFQEVPVETGEEQEKVVFSAAATLFEFADGGWKERGKGDLKVNVSEVSGGRSRLLMRSKGNYRLLLNASLYPDMKMTNMDGRGLTFVCVNSAGEGNNGLTTYAVKLRDSLAASSFREIVDTQKGTFPVDLKTPENSPRASHDSGRDIEAGEL